MTTRPSLFLDTAHTLTFEKIAMPVKLSDSPDAWQREIASEIFKQIPYLGDYSVNVILDRVDANRGFAFGSAQITNKSDSPEPQQAQLPSVRIPLIVRERLLLPMDVFMDGKGVFPLSESRLRERLFRASSLEISTRTPSDQGLSDQLYPPTRDNLGGGGSQMGMGKNANAAEQARKQMVSFQRSQANAYPSEYVGKYSSGDSNKTEGLIDSIAHTIPASEADEFVSQISGDMALKVAAARNVAFSKLAMRVAATDSPSIQKTAEALVSSIKPTVIQLQKLASGNFLVKWANAEAFAPQQDTVGPEAANQMGGDKVLEMGPGDTLTVSTNKAKKNTLAEEKVVQISDFGTYRVHDVGSAGDRVGHCIPLMDFDMHPLEMFVWTDGQEYACQDQIAGVRVGHDMNMPFAAPQGTGVFVNVTDSSARGLLPLTISNTMTTPEGTTQLMAETMFGEQVTLSISPGLQTIQTIGENEYAIPDTLQWLPLEGKPLMLAKQPTDIGNQQAAQAAPSTVEIGSTGEGEFSMQGQPVEKLATSDRHFIKRAEAEFLLVSMGITARDASSLLKKAEKIGSVKIAGMRRLVPLSSVHKAMVKKAAQTLRDFPYDLRRNLVKEASVLEDGETADKILAMNFLNPENISTFAAYLPELDKASSKLAEMLVAARLGLGQVDEGAIERSMKNLEVVIEGLKALQQRELI